MKIVVNGEERTMSPPRSLKELIESYGLQAEKIAGEVNGRVIARSDFENTSIEEGDRVELIKFLGGG